MGLFFNVQLLKPLHEFLEKFNNYFRDEPFQKDVNKHVKQLTNEITPRISTIIGRWSTSDMRSCWRSSNCPEFGKECPLKEDLDVLVQDVKDTVILILECPTGAGKSILSPAFLYRFFERSLNKESFPWMFNRQVPFKVIHLLPTGEQVHQNSQFVKGDYRPWFVTSAYSSSRNMIGVTLNDLDESYTNYLYCTHFFGVHALETNGLFHAVVIDEIHEITPTVVYLFLLIRRKLEQGQIWKVLFLTATLPQWLIDAIGNYFDWNTILIRKRGHSAYGTDTIMFGDPNDPIGSQAIDRVDAMDGPTDEQTLYENECSNDIVRPKYGITPNTSHIVKRAVEQAYKYSEDFLNQYENMIDIPKTGGVIVFLPGAADTVLAFTEFTKKRENLPHAKAVDVLLVNGKNRGNINALKLESTDTQFRVVFSTHILTTGVTVIGIDNVIDCGIHKFPSQHNIQNVSTLVSSFEDEMALIQRRGRVGRLRKGSYYTAFTKKRMEDIMKNDYSFVKLMAMYETNDVVQILNYRNDMFILMEQELYDALLLECGIQGWFEIDYGEDPELRIPRIDCIGKALSHCFCGLPLDCGLFLLYSSSLGVLLHSVIFLASHLTQHSLLKKPSNKPDRFGRLDNDHPMNAWPYVVGGTVGYSDMLLYIEIVLNLWMNGTGRIFTCVLRQGPINVPPYMTEQYINKDVLWDLNRTIMSLLVGLQSMNIIDSYEQIFNENRSGVKPNIRNGFQVLQLTDSGRRAFNVAVLGAFGSRIAGQKNTNSNEKNMGKLWNRTVFKIPRNAQPGGDRDILIQGECARPSYKEELIVYHSIYERTEEPFSTTFIHQVSPLHILLYANTYGAFNDVVDFNKKQLIIHGVTGSSLFQFNEVETLNVIARYRKYMKLLPSSNVYNAKHLLKDLCILADEELNVYIKVEEEQSATVIPTINHYRDIRGVEW